MYDLSAFIYSMNKSDNTPKLNPYTIDDVMTIKDSMDSSDIYTLIQLIDNATEQEITNVFSNWIDKDIKRRSDILELHDIKWDIDNYKDVSNTNSMPKISTASHWQSTINIFTNIKEEIIWEIINFIDIPDYIDWICNDIRIIQPQIEWKRKFTNEENVKNIWFNYIIHTIRNWLMHNRYLITKNGLYIHSEKAWRKKTSKKDNNWNNIVEEKDFEAFIDFSFFLKIIKFSFLSERKQKVKTLDISKIDRKKWFYGNEEKLRLKEFESKGKWSLYRDLQDKILYRVDEERNGKVQHYSPQKLSNGQKEFMSEYFKINEFNRKNLEFLWWYFVDECRNERIDLANNYRPIWINAILLTQKEYFQIYFTTIKDVIVYKVMNSFLEWDEPCNWKIRQDDIKIGQSIENKLDFLWIHKPYSKNYAEKTIELKEMVLDLKYIFLSLKDRLSSWISFRKNYLKVLYLSKFYVNNPNLELAQPQKRTKYNLQKQWYDYIINKCKSNPKCYWSKDAKEKHIDQALWRPFRERLFKNLTIWKMIDKWIIKDTEDINKIMDKINPFITKSTKLLPTNHKQILVDNVKNVIKDWKETLDNTTIIWEEEHIRNAFAHHNYTIVPWFNKILLQDPSRDDNPDWEKIYDLDELYENCVNNVEKCFLGKAS